MLTLRSSSMKKYLSVVLCLCSVSTFAVSASQEQKDLLSTQNSYQSALTDLEKAKKNHKDAQSAVSDAKKDLDDAKNNLNQATTKLEQRQRDLVKAQQKLQNAEMTMANAKNNLNSAWNRANP